MSSRVLVPLLAILTWATWIIPAEAAPSRGVSADEIVSSPLLRGAFIDRLDSLGAEMARVNINMEYLLPEGSCGRNPVANPAIGQNECTINWKGGMAAQIEDTVRRLGDRGIQTLGVAVGSPKWAHPSVPPGSGYFATRPDPDYHEYYFRFVRLVVRHLAPLGLRAIEVWNEANSAWFWGAGTNPRHYARLLAGTNAVADAESAELGIAPVQIGVAGPMPIAAKTFSGGRVSSRRHDDWLKRVYKQLPVPARQHYDFIAAHPYPLRAGPRTSAGIDAWLEADGLGGEVYEHVKKIRDDSRNRRYAASRPIWITEVGFTTCDQLGLSAGCRGSWRQVTEAEQSELYRRALDMVDAKRWIRGLFIFNLSAQPQYRGNWWYGSGLLDEALQPRPSYDLLHCRWVKGAQAPCG